MRASKVGDVERRTGVIVSLVQSRQRRREKNGGAKSNNKGVSGLVR